MQGIRPDGDGTGLHLLPRDRRLAYQAAAGAIALALGGCSIPKEVNPVVIYREVTGIADEGRLPPPGLDLPFPNLSVVPPRPERPPLGLREGVTNALVADRARSRDPLEPDSVAAPVPGFAPAPGQPPIPAGPPERPSLAGAPPIPWLDPVPAAAPARPGPAAAPTVVPAPEPVMPAAPPAAPPPDLLGPPPPPSPDLLAPAPARLH